VGLVVQSEDWCKLRPNAGGEGREQSRLFRPHENYLAAALEPNMVVSRCGGRLLYVDLVGTIHRYMGSCSYNNTRHAAERVWGASDILHHRPELYSIFVIVVS
jgi:hypothetical protein